MKIKTKLSLEVILLISLVSMVSLIAIFSTQQVQENFLVLSTETMPILDTLKDMRLATSQISSTTMEILLLEDDIMRSGNSGFQSFEEQIEIELFEMENAKALFTEAITRYSILTENEFLQTNEYRNNIANAWEELISSSNKMISFKSRGANSDEILQLRNEFEDAEFLMNQAIHSAITYTEPSVGIDRQSVQTTVDSTTMTILIGLNVFIVASLSIRYFILNSISKPLIKLRKTTTQIAQGNFIETGLTGRDEISELGRDIDSMSEELAKLNKEIVTSERLSSIGSLASRLAHDLRNPLSVIKNSLEILTIRLSSNMDEKVDHQLAMVGRAVSRMSHQIEDVLDFVNVAALKLEAKPLLSIIESARLSTDIPEAVKINMPKNSVTVVCDPYRLEVVLSNMLKNASQAVNGKGEISIRIIDQTDRVLIEIEDSGHGIPDSVLPKIFEPLFTTKQTGTGLGLASCKSIIEKHGGTILVRNNPTVFTIELPKIQDPDSPYEGYEESSIVNE